MTRCLRCHALIAGGSYCRGCSLNYSGPTWQALVAAVLTRDGHACTVCGKPCPHATGGRGHADVDHIIPRASGGSDDMSNLRTLCRSANRGTKPCTGGGGAFRSLGPRPLPAERRPSLKLARNSGRKPDGVA